MVGRRGLPFKLGRTDEWITPHAGLALAHEFHLSLGVDGLLDDQLPPPGSNRGYRPSEVVLPTVLMLQGGGRDLGDIARIARDKALRAACGLTRMPAPSTLGDWLRRTGSDRHAMRGLRQVRRELTRRRVREGREREFTLDVDATIIEAHKADATRAYDHTVGYQPLMGFLFEHRWLLEEEFRTGSVPAQAGAVRFLRRCRASMPRGSRIKRVRSDSAFYRTDVVEFCEAARMEYVICADWDSAVKRAYKGLPRDAWTPARFERTGRRREVAETVHTFEKGTVSFRLVFVRDYEPQQQLFERPARGSAIITNIPAQTMTPAQVVACYNERGTAENFIKELKHGFGMIGMPCSQQNANAAWLRIGTLAYDLVRLQQACALPEQLNAATVGTIRWRFYQKAARLVRHAGALVLKLAAGVQELLQYQCFRRAARALAVP